MQCVVVVRDQRSVHVWTQMQASKHAQVRQLAAMLLRRRLSQLWNKLDSAVKENIKTSLLAGILQETERPIRKNVAWYVQNQPP